jgi:hypothetical protein
LRDPAEHIELGPGQSWGPVLPLRPHRVTNAGTGPATFLVLHGIGDYDFVPPDDSRRPRRPVIACCMRGWRAAARTPR